MPIGGNSTEPRRRAPRVKTTLTKEARKANDGIYDLIHNKYFSAVPLDRLFDLVEAAGFAFDPDDKQCILCGRTGKASWNLRDKAGRDVDHVLVLQWHKMEPSGRYEIVSYVS